MPELLDLAKRIADSARPGEEVEAYVSRHPTPTSAYTRATWSRSPRRSRRGSGSASCRGAVRASPTSATSTRTSPARRWTRRGTTPALPRPTRTWALRRPTASRPSRSSCGATPWRRSRRPTRSRSPSTSRRGCVPATPGSARSSAPTTATVRPSRQWQPRRASRSPAGGPTATCRPTSSPARATTPRRASATRSAGRPTS